MGTSGDTATVTFEVKTPTLTTRAVVGDGTTAKKLYVGVYENQNGTLTGPLEVSLIDENETVAFGDDRKAIVNLALAKNKKYSVIFWAEADENGVYSIDWENKEENKIAPKLSIDPENLFANQESYDAFWAQKDVEMATNAISEKVELKRPFAQLNIGTSDKDLAAAAGIVVKNSQVVVKDAYTTFNLQTGNAEGEADVTYAMAAIAGIKDQNFPAAGQEYLSLNYLLMNTDKSTVDVTFSYEDEEDTDIYDLPAFTSVPVQRNYRTNIYGTLLTNSANYTVEINPVFDETAYNVEAWDGKSVQEPEASENTYKIEKPSELAWLAMAVNGTLTEEFTRSAVAANEFAGKTFVLTEDVDLGGKEWTPIGSSNNIFKGTFDGQGHTIKNLVVNGGKESNKGLFGVTHDGEIKNFTVENAQVSGRLNVGVVAGQPYTSKYTDITVKGHVEVNGLAYVGGVGGKNAYADWTNIKVEVDETSYVKAHSIENGSAYRTYVGGVVGFNGEGGHTFSNITSNINVEGSTCDVGGLFGIAHYGNQFVNCVCTGNVEIYAAEEAEEAQEIGGIAGVWHNETGTSVTFTKCSFTGELNTNIEGVNFYYDGLVGKPYSANGTGKLIIDGGVAVSSIEALQAAINAATSETTIALYADMEGNVTVVQKAGVKITIDGKGKKFNGSIKVHSNSNHYADAALTIKNVNFETSAASVNVIEALENGAERYSTNITVDNCSFTATGDAVNTSVGVQIKASKNAKVLNCTATDMHSLLQAQSCDETVVVKGCTINGKNGVAFKQVKAATVEGTTITALEYGIRFDGNIDNYGITVKNNNVTAVQPLIVRKMTGKNNTITLEGTNTLTTEAEYQIVITNGSDDAEYVKPTGTYTLTGAEGYSVYPVQPKANFADNDWSGIISACQDNSIPETWKVGDIKTMTIGGATYNIAIIGKNHDAYSDGSGKAPLTFQLLELYGTTAKMNETQTNTTGWSGSKMRTTTMGEVLYAMPSEVQNAIKAVNKETLNGTRDGLETTSDKLFLLSEIEVNGSIYFSNNFAEGSRYAYYANGGSAIMYSGKSPATWWLRGPGKNNAIGFTQINSSGYMANGSAEYACGVVFGFCF